MPGKPQQEKSSVRLSNKCGPGRKLDNGNHVCYDYIMSTRYTEEQLREAVRTSYSLMQVLAKVGLAKAGGNHYNMKIKLEKLEIDTSHFLGQAINRGKIDSKRKSPEQILIILPKGSQRAKLPQLRRALAESGVDHQCSICYNNGEWQGQKLVLEIDHINGEWLDNRLENLRYLCPNCHSQQPTQHRNKIKPS